MSHPPVVIVDENDRVLGEAPLLEARAQGIIYRVVFIIARNQRGDYLLQRRAPTLRFFANCWDTTASGHVDDGHSYEEAALLELEEEVGVTGLPLEEIAHFFSDIPIMDVPAKRYVKIFRVHLEDTPTKFGADEVTDVRWFTKQEIIQLMQGHPELAAEGLFHMWDRQLL